MPLKKTKALQAYIDSSLYGIPFEGLDSFLRGKGSMKGILGKPFTLFDERGADMDQVCLVTFLAGTILRGTFSTLTAM